MKLSILICILMAVFLVPGFSQPVPPLTVTMKNRPAPGFLYIAPNSRVPSPPYAASLLVLDSNGASARSRIIPEYAFDFRPLPDGRFGYSVFQSAASGPRVSSSIYIVDSLLRTVDSLNGSNGYNLAMHSFMVLPNGNRLVVMQEDVVMDMSKVVPGGHPAASVQQMILQELDIAGRVVFQWRALDHFPVTASYEDLTAPSIRYFHLNAVDVDTDGHFLISARHSSLVAKIHRFTGEVLWILGGKLNQFTFSASDGITDPPEFSYQHDIRRLPNGNISLFDNGTQRTPQWSRGVEYELDEVNKTCKLVWQYRNTPELYAGVQGSMQTLPNGNRVIAWGSALLSGQTVISEVRPNGELAFEGRLPGMMFPYKAEKHAFPPGKPADTVLIDEILPKNTYTYTNSTDTVGLKITYHTLISFFYNTTTAMRYTTSPMNPVFAELVDGVPTRTFPPVYVAPTRITITQEGMVEHGGEFRFDNRRLQLPNPERLVVYRRDTIGRGLFYPLRTRYNPNTREFIVDTTQVGEFCFGLPRPKEMAQLQAPRQISPVGGKRVLIGAPIILQSSGQGLTMQYQNLVTRSSGGQDVKVHERSTRFDKDTTVAPVVPGVYKWYSSATWELSQPNIQASQQSVDSFEVALPFLSISEPSTPKVWTQDSSYIVVWETNVPGDVSLELVKGTDVYSIADSVLASSGGFRWLVPVSVPPGAGYAVRVRSRAGSSIVVSETSDAVIEIRAIEVSVAEADKTPVEMNIMPNPASNVVYVSSSSELRSIDVFHLSGERVFTSSVSGMGSAIRTDTFAEGAYIVVVTTSRGQEARTLLVRK